MRGGGALWKSWNKELKASLTAAIQPKGCERGSWPPEGNNGRVYSTAMGALCLQTYYRFHVLGD